mmetsp:Transcript_19164/g.43303  ORF Transcript_19164/g.43303 Transcript_19164/m.43303 type:complete len:223 (-) Transcript_19164:266-934(-)
MCPWWSTSAVMTLPSVSRDWLMDPASRRRSFLAPERPTHSEPARSTRFSCPWRITSSPSTLHSLIMIFIVKIEWEREDLALQRVEAVCLSWMPLARISNMSFSFSTVISSRFWHTTPFFTSSHSFSFFSPDMFSRSCSSSLYSSRKDTRIVNSAPVLSRLCRIPLTDRGTIPASSSEWISPSMVCVLPVPVWPYAKMVQLNPSSTSSTMGRTISSYTSDCLE